MMNRVKTIIVEAIVLACISSVVMPELSTGSTSYYFDFHSTPNTVNNSIVVETHGDTESVLHCSMRCVAPSVVSFYYVAATSTCYCGNQTDDKVVQGGAGDDVTYGNKIKTVFNPSGVSHIEECQLLFDQGCRATDIYSLPPYGTFIYCNMSALGWTVFQRRRDGSVDFYRNWQDYVNGFGDVNGEFWMGLEAIHQATEQGGCELHIYLEAGPNNITEQENGYARYSNFSVGGADTNYTLFVGEFSGNVGDGLNKSKGMGFSTYDADHDKVGGASCAAFYKASWWMSSCFMGNLNGLYQSGHTNTYATGIVWNQTWGLYYSLLKAEMAFRCQDFI